MAPMTSKILLALAFTPCAFLGACPDPQGGFDDFVKRSEPYRIKPEPGQCVTAFDISGHYLFGASVVIGRDKPLRFDATITVDQSTTPWGIDWSMHALAVADGAQVGDVIHGAGTLGADGAIAIDFGEIVVAAPADPILPDTPVTTTFVLSGCTSSTTFACGPFDGQISKPTGVPLAGSTWALTPVPEGQDAKDQAIVSACPASTTPEAEGAAETAPENAPETTP